MYKTVYLDYMKYGWDIQLGKTAKLDALLNEWDKNGYDLVSMTVDPYPIDSSKNSYVLVFKSRQ